MLFNGVLQKTFTKDNNRNMLLPSENYILSVSKAIPSINDLPRQSTKGRSKRKSSNDNTQFGNTLPTINSESFYGGSARSRGSVDARNSSSSANKLIDTEDKQSHSGLGGGAPMYAGSRNGRTNVSEVTTYSGTMPFTDGINSLPKSSAPQVGPGNTILIDPMTDPEEKNRIPVGEGLGIMLFFVAAFSVRKVFRSRSL